MLPWSCWLLTRETMSHLFPRPKWTHCTAFCCRQTRWQVWALIDSSSSSSPSFSITAGYFTPVLRRWHTHISSGTIHGRSSWKEKLDGGQYISQSYQHWPVKQFLPSSTSSSSSPRLKYCHSYSLGETFSRFDAKNPRNDVILKMPALICQNESIMLACISIIGQYSPSSCQQDSR